MHSIIIEHARRAAKALRQSARNSNTARMLQRMTRHTSAALSDGYLAPLSNDGFDHTGPLYRLRRTGMLIRERSRICHALASLRKTLLASRVGDLGLFLLLTGILLFILTLLIPDFAALRHRAAGGLFVLLALPLLPSGKSLSQILRRSRAVSLLLFGLCALPRDRLESHAPTAEHPLAVLALSALSVAIAALISPFRFLLAAFAIPLIALLLSFPELLLTLIALAFPLLPLLPMPTVITSALAAAAILSYFGKALCGRRELTVDPCDLLVFLFLLALLLGAFIGFGDPMDGITVSLLCALYFPSRHLLTSPRQRSHFRTALLLGAFFCASYGILQYFFSDTAALWLDTERFSDISRRVTGSFSNPNVLAVYLLLCHPIALCGMLDPTQSRVRRAFFALTAVAIALCTVLTWTRGAWLGLLAQLALFLLFHSAATLTAGILSLPFAVCALAYLPRNVLHRFMSIGTLAESSIRYRIHTWQGVERLLAAHPWGIGVGEKAFCAVYPRYALSGIESVMHAHSIYLQIALETGVIGLILFLSLVVTALLRGADRRAHFGAGLSLIGVLCMGCFDHLWYFRPLAALFFIMIAMCMRDGQTDG